MTDFASNLLGSSLPNRRTVLRGLAAGCAASILPAPMVGAAWSPSEGRPQPAERRFTSAAVESTITRVGQQISDLRLRAIFERCFPNPLDTTVFPGTFNGHPDTFVITGDIDAMWLRDSSAQMHPYLRFAREDKRLARLLEGVVRRQTRLVLIDPYANAFVRSPTDPPLEWARHDHALMKHGVGERKWEVDSLCYVIRLAHGYWRATGDTGPFDSEWQAAAGKILQTFRQQQRLTNKGPYSFARLTTNPYDTVPLDGYGNLARPLGMIYSMFRPSDDSCIYPLFVPANLFAIRSLAQLREIAAAVSLGPLAAKCDQLLRNLGPAVKQYGSAPHTQFGTTWAYEVDGYGNRLLMDDANAPSLISLPYLGCCSPHDPLYRRTRQFVLSNSNPYFFKSKSFQGVGSPHTGDGKIWPLGIILRGLTSTDPSEIRQCIQWLRDSTAGTDFMHESFDMNDPSKYTRPWFAWANALFGDLIVTVATSHPEILREI